MAAWLHAEVMCAAAWLRRQCQLFSIVTGLQPLLHFSSVPLLPAGFNLCHLTAGKGLQELPYVQAPLQA